VSVLRKATVIAGVSLLLMASNTQLATAGIATVRTSAEAWYRLLGPCPAVGGCPTGPTQNPYPAHTLHVGVTLGQEDSRTYLSLDLASVPARPSSGVLTLPLASTDAGTQNAETAQLMACLATDPVADVEGSDRPPPSTDCTTNTNARFVTGPGGPAFTIDLTPFLPTWTPDVNGLAIMAAEEARAPGTSWHVAFNGRFRKGFRPISARLTYESPAAPAGSFGRPNPDVTPDVVPFVGEIVEQAPVESPQQDQESAVLSVAPLAQPDGPAARDGEFAYAWVFWLPLVILVVAGYLAYGLTRRVPIRRT
jgi:hypothetical protein